MAVTEEECSTAAAKLQSPSSSSSSASADGVHFLAKCVLKPSVVLQLAYGHFRSPSSPDIVFGKETSIELVIIGDDGIVQSISEQAVFGTIKDIAVIPWNEKRQAQKLSMIGKDILAVVSDSGKLSFLTFCNEMHRFFPLAHVQLSPPGNARHQVGRMLAVDSSGCFVAVSAYEEKLALCSLSMSDENEIIDKKICHPTENEGEASINQCLQKIGTSGAIWSMCFISNDSRQPTKKHDPTLAVVHTRRDAQQNELLLLRWNIEEHAINVISQYVENGPLAHSIVEVPHSPGFAFLFRIGDLLLMNLTDAHNPVCVYRTSLTFLNSPIEEQNFVEDSYKLHDVDDEGLSTVAACALLELREYDPMCIDSDEPCARPTAKYACCWSWETGNEQNPRMIFCLDTGEFIMAEVLIDSDGPRVVLSECVYRGPPCKEILWVGGGFVAALVEMGDGMVLKVEDGSLLITSSIQNIAPILDVSILDHHDEKCDQMFACCGFAPEGSLRVIRSGINVEKLLKTPPIYQGVTGTWTIKMRVNDSYHSFLVLSFVEETRVLAVGVSFTDVTDSVGFQPDVCTLACGLVGDGLLVQIHLKGVRLCLPTVTAHSEGVPLSHPVYTSWFPDDVSISLGAVQHDLIIVSTSNPCFLSVLGVRFLASYQYEIYEMHRLTLQHELSCISISQKDFGKRTRSTNLPSHGCAPLLPSGIGVGYTFVIGTHKPSVEVLSFVHEQGVRVLATGVISLTNTMGTAISGCIPQDVRLILVDQLYVLLGLRNGMLLRFEWPSDSPGSISDVPFSDSVRSSWDKAAPANSFSSGMLMDDQPADLQLIATRRIGITPVFLVPLSDSLDADIIALSDRPWLLHTARHSLSYTSISFQPSTHATPVSSVECPKGILFVADSSLHLVEMVHTKRLNVQKFHLGGTPRQILYHSESKLLVVLRTELINNRCSSDICCVDPLTGTVVSSYKLIGGEIGKCMELLKVGNEELVVVGTSLSSGPGIMPSGEAENTKGRLLVLCLDHVQNSDSGSMTFCSKAGSSCQRTSPLRDIGSYAMEHMSSSSLCSSPDDNSCDGVRLDETETWVLRVASFTTWPGMVLAICPYLGRYFLASAGNAFYVCGFPIENSLKVKRFAVGRTRFMITSLTTNFTRISVGDCRDGILFYAYHEDARKLEQVYCDPSQRLVADCLLMDVNTAVVSDRKGGIAVLSCTDCCEENASPESNLTLNCGYYMGEIAMSIKKGSFIYKFPADDVLRGYEGFHGNFDSSHSTIVASTLLGSIITFIPILREEYELLEAVQARLVLHPLTAPILGNDHNEFRSRELPIGVRKILDGDMLAQFLELTSLQQDAVLSLPLSTSTETLKLGSKFSSSPIPLNRVVQLLERVHYALN
ncbi:uncharacterized protein [Rutidosis leptorrhynchoides]|uniref:uncharacterized protein n=1 Tax=Rutidosis leptorrhynchoides TaxID=125765 RepID=UPI003A98F36A